MINIDNYLLRPVEKKDLEWIRKLRNDESTWSQLGTFTFIYEATQKNWFENLNKTENKEYLVFAKGRKNLGLVRLTEIDKANRSMCVGGDILPKFRGKGLSKIMYKLIFKLGFDVLGMNRLWLLVLETNKIAINAYRSIGFVEEGRQRQAIFRNGDFIDYVLMSILANEYYEKFSRK